MKHVGRKASPGFTLIETLVVCGVIGTLVAILIPAVQMARESMRRSTCASNLRQIGLALHSYTAQHNLFPKATGYSAHARLLPFLEQGPLFNAINFEVVIGDWPNTTAMQTRLKELICPSDSHLAIALASCSYSYNTGYGHSLALGPQNGPFGDHPVGYADVTDGTSTTAAVAECPLGGPPDVQDLPRSIFKTSMDYLPSEFEAFVTECANLDTKTAQKYDNGTKRGQHWFDGNVIDTLYNHNIGIGSHSCTPHGGRMSPAAISAGGGHPGGCQVLFLDGHVEFPMRSLELNVWRALGSRNGGELLEGR